MSSSTSQAPTERMSSKRSEFNDGRKRPIYSWSDSFRDWVKQSFYGNYTDLQVESNLLSVLPFYPESDGKRIAKVINTDIGNGNYIHELYIENIETPIHPDFEQESQIINNNGVITTTKNHSPRDVVLIHGYAASLGLFIDNFDSLSKIPGIKIHAIDLLGFGFSARPNFPNFKSETAEDVKKTEDWFIDAIEIWRQKRNINRFVLMGHSFGGYLSCCYALKYQTKLTNNLNLIDKLVLISPVGLERNKFSLLKNIQESYITKSSQLRQNEQSSSRDIEQEVLANQEEIVSSASTTTSTAKSINEEATPMNNNESSATSEDEIEDEEDTTPKTRRAKIIRKMWDNNFSPFSIVRNVGPMKSKLISGWTTHRFSHVYYSNPQHFQNMHDYIYRVFNAKGSGEYAITRVLAFGALAKLPLLDRCPEKFVDWKLPTLWLYGDKDWMNEEAGEEMTKEINQLAKKKNYNDELARFRILSNSGHHLYLDNPPDFAKEIFSFLKLKK
ncbi:Alpha/Beta hydrolase protein [Scheffersomyces coipomensis]|uniref:Alpha/Beta hydrolase protein n=1 Tax=Scheffersomyces coipomensis TaxID=1788519 RepID=UPI00315D2805